MATCAQQIALFVSDVVVLVTLQEGLLREGPRAVGNCCPCFLNLVRAPFAAAADLQRHLSDSDHHLEDRNEGDDSEDGLENSYGDLSLYLETWLLHGYPMGMGHGRSDTSGEGQAMYPGFDWIIYNIYIYIFIYVYLDLPMQNFCLLACLYG